MARINKHLESLKPSATLAINERVKALRSQGESICHFGFGQSPFPIHPKIVQSLQAAAEHNSYLPSLGLPALREQISKYLEHYHNLRYDHDLIFLGPGSKELLFQTVMILDHIFLIPQGSWVSYLPQIKAKGGRHRILETFPEDNYKLGAKSLDDHCRRYPEEKFVLVINSPNNPTGAVYTAPELQELAVICRKYDILVLSDEIYSRICFQEESAPSMAQYYPEGTILFSGLSKIFSAGGYRCGLMALPEALRELRPIFRSLFSETFSAVASPVQYAALTAFGVDAELETTISRNTAVLKTIGTYIHRKLSTHHIRCTQPMGAFYFMIDLSEYQEALLALDLDRSEKISEYMLDHYQVAVLPGSDFYFDPSQPIFRLAFVDFDGSGIPADWQHQSPEELVHGIAPNMARGISQLIQFCSDLANTMPLRTQTT